jgi:hypothetical protein
MDSDPSRIAAAITDLLIRHGYPPGRVDEWWNHASYAELGGHTPTSAWLLGEYEAVLHVVESTYAASEKSAHRTATDRRAVEQIRQKIADLDRLYT